MAFYTKPVTNLDQLAGNGCILSKTGDQAITVDTDTDVTWDDEIVDVGGIHAAGAAAVTLNKAGWWRVTAIINSNSVFGSPYWRVGMVWNTGGVADKNLYGDSPIPTTDHGQRTVSFDVYTTRTTDTVKIFVRYSTVTGIVLRGVECWMSVVYLHA